MTGYLDSLNHQIHLYETGEITDVDFFDRATEITGSPVAHHPDIIRLCRNKAYAYQVFLENEIPTPFTEGYLINPKTGEGEREIGGSTFFYSHGDKDPAERFRHLMENIHGWLKQFPQGLVIKSVGIWMQSSKGFLHVPLNIFW